ncbi:MAG: protein jag [Bryobacteraceae bacterium]
MSERKYSVARIGRRIDDFLRDVLTRMEVQVDYEIADGNPRPDDFETPDVVVRFSGSDVDALLANKAELLLALEHLTSEMLRLPSEDHSRLCFDANDYRLLRIEELRVSALTAAEKVKRTGQPFRFNPMNSRERRVIHLALRNDADVRSESAGAGPFRGVVVYPAGMPSLPDGAVPPPPPMRGRGGRARGARR